MSTPRLIAADNYYKLWKLMEQCPNQSHQEMEQMIVTCRNQLKPFGLPLYHAFQNGCTECIDLFIKYGANEVLVLESIGNYQSIMAIDNNCYEHLENHWKQLSHVRTMQLLIGLRQKNAGALSKIYTHPLFTKDALREALRLTNTLNLTSSNDREVTSSNELA
jgi:hypothetical protein